MRSLRIGYRTVLSLVATAIVAMVVAVGGGAQAPVYCLDIASGCYPSGDSYTTVSITGPSNGATVTGTATITASVTTSSGGCQACLPAGMDSGSGMSGDGPPPTTDPVPDPSTTVEFYVDGNLVGTDYTSPYSYSWNTLDPANTAFDGQHTLMARAYTASGVSQSGVVTVTTANTASTQYRAAIAPPVTYTPPQAMFDAGAGQTYPVDVQLTNQSGTTWQARYVTLRYRWYSPDATPVVTDSASISLGTDLGAGATRVIHATVTPPTLPDGVERAQYQLRFDLFDSRANTFFGAKGNQPLDNPIIVNKSLDDALGLERYYHYEGDDVGAGMTHLVNVANGNSILRWSPWASPGRGLSTLLDLTYNSLEQHSDSPLGNNWSLSISGLSRLGLPIDIHPNDADRLAGGARSQSKWISFVDGDGTPHRFDGHVAADGTVYWTEPPGVHLYLHSTTTDTTSPRFWAFTRPDRVTFYYDHDGFPTSVVDRNGNAITYSYQDIPPGDDPGKVKKRIVAVTDAGGRSFTLDYLTKAEVKKAQLRGKVQSISDHTGHVITFDYYADGNLRQITQIGGLNADGTATPARVFTFTYTTADGSGPAITDPIARSSPDPNTANESTRIFSVFDPRRYETTFSYYGPGSAQLRWRLASRTDRLLHTTSYAYDIYNRVATVTDPLGLVSRYGYDTDGKATSITNPNGETTTVTWSPDFAVTKVTEPTGAARQYAYNDNGYLTDYTDELGNHTRLVYDNLAVDGNDVQGKWASGRSSAHISQLTQDVEPKGVATATVPDDFQWLFAYDTKGNLVKVTDPEGHPTPANPAGKFTSYDWNPDGTLKDEVDPNGHPTDYLSYDLNGLVTQVRDAEGRVTTFSYDADGLLLTVRDPNHANATASDPRWIQSTFDYDPFRRLIRQSSPKDSTGDPGKLIWSAASYDPNDNLVTQTQPYYSDAATTFVTKHQFDAMDRETLMTSPDTSADPLGERTAYTYDDDGRLTSLKAPHGTRYGSTNGWTTFFVYDRLDRLVKQTRYAVDTNDNITQTLNDHYCYDLAGDLRSVTPPKANVDSVDCAGIVAGTTHVPFTTTFTYDAAHKKLSETDPLGHTKSVTYDANDNVETETDELGDTATHAYDMRDLIVKTVEPWGKQKDADPERSITRAFRYDPAGNLTTEISARAWDASPDPEPNKQSFPKYVTKYVLDKVDEVVRTDLPNDGGEQHYVYASYDLDGNLLWQSEPVKETTATDVADVDKQQYTYYDTGWVKTSKDQARPTATFDYTAEGWQASRTPAGKPTEKWSYFPDGMLKTQDDPTAKTTTYTYDYDNLLETVDDQSGGTGNEKAIDVENDYDSLDRLTQTIQKKEGRTYWTFTTYGYDQNGNVTTRGDDGRMDPTDRHVTKPASANDFVYDEANWVQQQTDHGADPGCADDKKITSEFYATGWIKEQDVYGGNASCGWDKKKAVSTTYFRNGDLKTQVTVNGNGETLESHTPQYLDGNGFYVNGNRTADEFKRQGPAGTSCATSTCTQKWTYDAEERLTKWEDGHGGTTTYTLDPHGNVVDENAPDGSTHYTYTGDQIKTQTSGGVTANYWYDNGNLDCVTDATGSAPDCPKQGTDTAPAHVLQDWTYDPLLDRPNDTHDYGRGTSATYTYDAFDRVATEDDKSSGGTRHSDFDYLGLSDRVSQERHSGRDSDTKDFSYDAWGDVVGMKQTGTNAGQYTFGYDEHGSVSQLIDQAGQAKAAYGYTPYGDQDKQETVGDTTPDNPLNPYRYDEKRFDPGSGTLDMGARRFDPATGRFLQADLYKGALDDLDLATDPLTSNRYSLAGGNPINFVEIDGHWPDFVDHAIDKVKKVAKGAIHAVAGAARYCLGSGARTCATIAGTVALASTGVGLAAGVAGAATLATAATATATTASLTSSALSFNSYRRTGSKMDLVNGALGLADAGALGSATVSSARTLSRTKGIRRLMDESPREFDKVGIGRFAKRSQAGQHDYADDAQRAANRGFLREDGCHTCGVRSGSAVADHQPARALNEYAGGRWVRKPYRFYPQCRACSNEQGTQVKRLLERARARSWQRRLRDLWYR